MPAALPFLPAITAGASVIGGLMGGDEGGGGSPTAAGGSQSGFAALPPEVQQAFLQQYLPQLLQQHQGKLQTSPLGQADTGPFASRSLQELQDYSNQNGGIFGNGQGVRPLGQVEPLNQYQQDALGSFGGGFKSLFEDLPAYEGLYNQKVLSPVLYEIQRQQDMARNQLLGAKAGSGNLGALGSSALGTQLAQQIDDSNRLRLDAQAGAFRGAQGLRQQTLQDMLRAGGQIQGQNQTQLNALQPQLQATAAPARLQQLAQGLNQFPSGAIGQGQVPTKPDAWSKFGNFGTTATGLLQQFGGAAGGGGGYNGIPFGQSLGNAMPWL